MAITVTQRASVHSTTDAPSFTAAPAWTPAANTLLLAWVSSRSDGVAPTSVAGHGVTYSLKQSITTATNFTGLYVANSGATPTSVAVTATWGNDRTCAHIMEQEVDGEDLSGGAAAAIVQAPTDSAGSGTSGSITLAAVGHADNRPIAAFRHTANELKTPRVNWAELDDGSVTTPNNGFESQWRSDAFETTASATWATSAGWAGIAAEIKAEVTTKHRRTLLGVGV